MSPTAEQHAFWEAWLVDRPEKVRVVAARFEPWKLYRLKQTGQIVSPVSFHEHDGRCRPPPRGPHAGEPCDHCATGAVTMTVAVLQKNNPHLLLIFGDRNVFGIEPDDLEPIEDEKEDKSS